MVRITQRFPKRLLAMSLSKFIAHNIKVVDISITVSDLVRAAARVRLDLGKSELIIKA